MTLNGQATYFLESDTNTDIIIPARFLKRIHLDGFEPFAFYEKRYLAGTVCEADLATKDFKFTKKVLNPDFPLNQPHAKDATFLLTWLNFGCGSSREHAVYGLRSFKVIIGGAPEGKNAFADIFRENCRQNLIWTPVLSATDHKKLANYLKEMTKHGAVSLTLDTDAEKILSADGEIILPYSLPDHHRSYILAESDPFDAARKKIKEAQTQITLWRNAHKKTVEQYPVAERR